MMPESQVTSTAEPLEISVIFGVQGHQVKIAAVKEKGFDGWEGRVVPRCHWKVSLDLCS
jgi:hypothetical protein